MQRTLASKNITYAKRGVLLAGRDYLLERGRLVSSPVSLSRNPEVPSPIPTGPPRNGRQSSLQVHISHYYRVDPIHISIPLLECAGNLHSFYIPDHHIGI